MKRQNLEDNKALIRCLCVLSSLSVLVTKAEETCIGSFEFKSSSIHQNKLTAEENTEINITFFLKYDKCDDSKDSIIEISRLDKSAYSPQCNVVLKNDTCRGSLNTSEIACGCLDTPGAYSFRKTVTQSDNTDWKWSTDDKESAVITFHITDSDECQDSRTDCSQIEIYCSGGLKFALAGCRKTCLLCNSTFADSENVCQDIRNDCFLIANTCSTVKDFFHGCKKTCKLCNTTIRENIPEIPLLHLTSNKETGTNITVRENQMVNIICKPGNTATMSVFLSKENEIISRILIYEPAEKKFVKNSYTYTIQSAQCKDSGEYRCVALNVYGMNYSTATLRVDCDKHVCKLNEECATGHSETSADLVPSKEIFTQPNSDVLLGLNESTRITLGLFGTVIAVAVVVVLVLLHKYTAESQIMISNPNKETRHSRIVIAPSMFHETDCYVKR